MKNLLSQKQNLFIAEKYCLIVSLLLSTAELLTLIRICITLTTLMLTDVNLLINLNEDIHSRRYMSARFFKIASRKMSAVTDFERMMKENCL